MGANEKRKAAGGKAETMASKQNGCSLTRLLLFKATGSVFVVSGPKRNW
jgi:hypothetical protein